MMMMMILFNMYKRQFHTLITKHLVLHTKSNLCLTTPGIRNYAAKPNVEDSSEFKISFLQNKCGLSGKSLVRACKCVDFDSSDQRPDSVLDLFRTFGFPLSSITRIVSFHPTILGKYHPEQVLRPKLDFLLSISHSQADVVAIVTKTPMVLARSLNNHLKPSIDLLNSVTGSYPITISVLKHNPYILTQNLPKYLLLNTEFLLTFGVPHFQILKLLTSYGRVLGTSHDKLRNVLLKLKDLDFDLESSHFCHAVRTLCFVPDSTWESRCVLLRSFGFSDHEILSIFKRLPDIMCYTEKTIKEKMDFFLNKLHWTQFRLSSNPSALTYSLVKRTIPRCSVLQVLFLKNSTSESYSLPSILSRTESKFFKIYVSAHEDELPDPEVIKAWQGKLKFDEYTFKQKEVKCKAIMNN